MNRPQYNNNNNRNNGFNPNAFINQFQQLVNSGYSPQQLEQMMLQNNPNLQAIANQMKSSGLSPEQFVMQLAKQNNVPPQLIQQIMNGMKNVIPH